MGLDRARGPASGIYRICGAIQNLWLAACAEGLGVEWIRFSDDAGVARLLALPPTVQLIAYLCLGIPQAFQVQPTTTVVCMQRRAQPTLPDVCRDQTGRGFEASGATATTPGGAGPSAGPRGPCATRADEFRVRSAGGEAATGLAPRQPAVRRGGRQTFFERFHGDGPRAQGQRPHGARARPSPPPSNSGPRTDPGPLRPSRLHSAVPWSSAPPPLAPPPPTWSPGGPRPHRPAPPSRR
jgi:hypothetical protein